MPSIDELAERGKISRILETERERYLNFFQTSYRDDLEHCDYVLEHFPRWSIISGHYAMSESAVLHGNAFRTGVF